MASWLKEAISEEKRDKAQKQIRDTVEKLLEDIDKRGDAAVRELSKRFDNWSRISSGCLKKKYNPVLIDLIHKQLMTFTLHRNKSRTLHRSSGIP